MSRAPRPRVLVVDDDVRLSEALLRALESMGYEAAGVTDPAKGLERVGTWRPDAAVVDLRMPAMDGVTWAEKAMEADPDLPVLLLTGFGTIRSAVEAVKRGVFDYLAKPFDLDEVDVALRKALRHRELRARNRALSEGLAPVEAREGIVGDSPALREVLAAVSAVAPTDSTVLLIGESGTGKELVAKAIHAAGPRRDRPFVTVDCAALAGALLESELFGHARGSFTGAHRDRAGYLEVASDGTVFLDEIGELDLALQKKLLRALEERTYARVGETRRRQTGARIVAATNRDLGAEVEAGRFREDLYYRLRVIEIRVPPLRERLEDLPALVAHHMALLNRRLKRGFRGASPEALEALRGHSWPGNVRELVNLLEQVMTFHDTAVLAADQLPEHLRRPTSAEVPPQSYPDFKEQVLGEATRAYLDTLLRHYAGNVSRVAEHAGTDRRQVHRLLQRFGLDPAGYRD